MVLARAIKSRLRLPLEVDGNQNGQSSVQITSLRSFLESDKYRTSSLFKQHHPDVRYLKGLPADLTVFTWLDTDDATPEWIEKYRSGRLVEDHWLGPMIVPIVSTPNLEAIFATLEFPIGEDKCRTCEQFATARLSDPDAIASLAKDLALTKCTNLSEFLQFSCDWTQMKRST